jgi:hypothetical protein
VEEEREPPAKRAARAPADKLRAKAAEETFVVVEDEEFGEELAACCSLRPATEAHIKSVRGTDRGWTPRRRLLLVQRSSRHATRCGPRGQGRRWRESSHGGRRLSPPRPPPSSSSPRRAQGRWRQRRSVCVPSRGVVRGVRGDDTTRVAAALPVLVLRRRGIRVPSTAWGAVLGGVHGERERRGRRRRRRPYGGAGRAASLRRVHRGAGVQGRADGYYSSTPSTTTRRARRQRTSCATRRWWPSRRHRTSPPQAALPQLLHAGLRHVGAAGLHPQQHGGAGRQAQRQPSRLRRRRPRQGLP